MDEQVRFTPEEIRALWANKELDMDLLRKMHPDDQKVAQAIFNSGDYSNKNGQPASTGQQVAAAGRIAKENPLQTAGLATLLATPLAATGALTAGASSLAGELPTMAKVAGYTGLAALGTKLGIPASAMEAVALYMGMKGGMGKMTKGAPGVAAEAESVEQALINKGINPANAGMAARGEKFPTPARRSVVQPPAPSNLGNDALDVEKKIFGPQGSEAATFGARPPAYSPNVSTGASVDDILEMLTGSSHGQGTPDGSPIMYHGSDGPSTRSSVDKLKRATRRSPK
jgi:hypothetical protein